MVRFLADLKKRAEEFGEERESQMVDITIDFMNEVHKKRSEGMGSLEAVVEARQLAIDWRTLYYDYRWGEQSEIGIDDLFPWEKK